jgi:hypothetical protein
MSVFLYGMLLHVVRATDLLMDEVEAWREHALSDRRA